MPSVGMERATSRPPAITVDSSGRLRTRAWTAAQKRDSPLAAWRRLAMNGTRPFSSQFLRLRNASIAGRKVSEPSSAAATTSIVPTPKPTKIGLPEKSRPAIAVITVRPEISTARPEVAAARSTAASTECPRSRSSMTRRE